MDKSSVLLLKKIKGEILWMKIEYFLFFVDVVKQK